MEADPATACYLLKHILYGRCRYCGGTYVVNKSGYLRKHMGCARDYPDAMAVLDEYGEAYWARLDDLAQIASVPIS